jgi:predicted ribosome quality control (RQC) complex YloA/Tae2 family protein
MSNYGKPSDIHPLYGVWINNVIKKLKEEIEEAEAEARRGLAQGHLTPAQKAEVEGALRGLEQAERALHVKT